MKYLIPVLTISILSLFSSCKTTSFAQKEKTTMDSWLGHSKAELLQSWGPPTKVDSDGQGGEILTYDKSVALTQTPGTVYNNGYGGINYTRPQNNVVTRSRMFYVNQQGKIYHWLAQGRQGY